MKTRTIRSGHALLNHSLVCTWLVPLIILSSCSLADAITKTPTPIPVSFQDRSLLTEKPCEAPCWYGLELGYSDRADVTRAIGTLSFVDPETIQVSSVGFGEPVTGETKEGVRISLACRIPENMQCVRFTIVDDRLREVATPLNYDLTFGQAVEYLKTPDYINALILGVENIYCRIELVWEEKQVSIVHNVEDYDQALAWCEGIPVGKKLDPLFLVETVIYSSKERFEIRPETGVDFPWPGFEQP